MPARIEDALNFPVVKEVVKVAGEVAVQKYLEFELIKLAHLVSVGGNLNNAQVVFIAQELIKIFPNETLADFKLCFQRGAIGQYGEIFRMDGIVLREWMNKYLEEKYQVIENKLMAERDDHFKPVKKTELADPEAHQKWLDKLKEANQVGQKTKPITDDDIRKEGQQTPARKELYPHNSPGIIQMQIGRKKLLRAASEFYKDRRTLNLQSFEVEGIQFGAENEEDANEIYRRATET